MKPITPIEIIRRRFASADFPGSAPDTTPEPCEEALPEPAKPVPAHIAALIAQRGRAAASAFRPIPLAGQIVRVPPCADDKGQAYAEYLAVLLDKEIAVGKWRGWLVGRDADYASEWDLLLGPEEEPCDPLCQIVQIWNPLTLPIQQADRVLAELSAERLQATRSLEHDFGNQLIPSPLEDHRIGVHLARELTDGTGVVTGTPLAPQGDPRREYQQLYREATLWISRQDIAAGALANPPPAASHTDTQSELQRLTSRLSKEGLFPASPQIQSFARRWAAFIAAILSAIAFGALTMRLAMMPTLEGVRYEGNVSIIEGQQKLAQSVPVLVPNPAETMKASVAEASRLGLSFSVKAAGNGYDLLVEGLVPHSANQESLKQALGISAAAAGDLQFLIRRKLSK